MILVIVVVLLVWLVFPVTVWSAVSPASGAIAPPIQETIAEAPAPSVFVLSKNKGSPTV